MTNSRSGCRTSLKHSPVYRWIVLAFVYASKGRLVLWLGALLARFVCVIWPRSTVFLVGFGHVNGMHFGWYRNLSCLDVEQPARPHTSPQAIIGDCTNEVELLLESMPQPTFKGKCNGVSGKHWPMRPHESRTPTQAGGAVCCCGFGVIPYMEYLRTGMALPAQATKKSLFIWSDGDTWHQIFKCACV